MAGPAGYTRPTLLLQKNPSGLGRQEQAIGRELNGYTPR